MSLFVSSFDGIVVAKESEEVLLEAWQTEEQIILEKEMKVLKLLFCLGG